MDRANPRFNRTSLFLASTAHFINTRRTVLATYRGRTSHFTLAAKRTNKSRYHHPTPSYHHCCLNLHPFLSLSLFVCLSLSLYVYMHVAGIDFAPNFQQCVYALKGNIGLEFLRKIRQKKK